MHHSKEGFWISCLASFLVGQDGVQAEDVSCTSLMLYCLEFRVKGF